MPADRKIHLSVNDKDWAAFALNVSTHRGGRVTDTKLRWAGVVALLLLLCWAGLGCLRICSPARDCSVDRVPTAYLRCDHARMHTPAPAPIVVQVKKKKPHHAASHSLR